VFHAGHAQPQSTRRLQNETSRRIPALGHCRKSQGDLQNAGEIVVVNVFASWCLPCRAEHPVLTQMAEERGFRLVGIKYKDTPAKAAAWLDELGNPYAAIGNDQDGRAGLFLGITGVPETFIVGPDGIVRYKEAGPVLGDGKRRFLEALDAL